MKEKVWYTTLKGIDKSGFVGGLNMEIFEYKVGVYETNGDWLGSVESNQLENQLNLFGCEGWELVSCIYKDYSNRSKKSVVCIFKRKKNR